MHVTDHVNAIIKIGQKGKVGESYNIGGNCQINNLEVVNKICRILDQSSVSKLKINTFKDLILFVKDRPGHDERYAVDFSKLSNEIGWSPKIKFDQGLFDTVNWYIDNYKWWEKFVLTNKSHIERFMK